jgi:8-oxo-dGTP diphosphatase
VGEKRIEAAGGLVVREGPEGPEVVLVHRPRYDDWSLPKGKLEPGEGFEQAARREIEEETGLSCELGTELESNSYIDHKGRPKLVRWFRMTPTGGEFAANDEVDELRWLSPEAALELVDYEHDHRLIATLLEG